MGIRKIISNLGINYRASSTRSSRKLGYALIAAGTIALAGARAFPSTGYSAQPNTTQESSRHSDVYEERMMGKIESLDIKIKCGGEYE